MTKKTERQTSVLTLTEAVVKSSYQSVEKWKANFDRNPLQSFEWSGQVIKYAARIEVWTGIARDLAEHSIEEVAVEVRKDLLRDARSITNKSTDSMTNLCREATLEARADWLSNYFTSD